MQKGCLQYNGKAFRIILLTVLLLSGSMAMRAQTEKYIQSLTGNIKAGDSCVVTDDKFNDAVKWATIEKHWSVNNLVTFELRYDTIANYFTKKFSCKLQADIEYEKADRTKQQLKNISLEVNFDTARGSTHQGIAYYKFKDAHNVKITVKSITSGQWGKKIPPIFRIKNEIFIERAYVLNTSVAASSVSALGNTSEPKVSAAGLRSLSAAGMRSAADISGQQEVVSWDPQDPALQGYSQYDFEWTFYDDYSTVVAGINNGSFVLSNTSLEGLFKNNCSRVTIGLSSYQLNLIYSKGLVFHRVRGVSYNEATGVRQTGLWSYAGSYTGGWGVIAVTGHEEYINWQYNHSFAEEGKRKEVVSYFDGSLRNRQSVTLNNDITGSRTIVQENVYDALGRATVNILPAPTEETDIHYFHDFNTSAVTGRPYNFRDIEEAGVCAKLPAAMSTSTGASQYYSANNPKKDDNTNQYYFTKYIPDAQGYPFAVTHFTPDNTGRIRAQGGVGNVFQPGKPEADDHTTQYFYGKPQQDELDRLFGNEAGNASHYLKNMVIDANGQTSVSYVNASGKTVATALAGKSPANLQTLPSYQLKSAPFITTLTNRDNIVRDAANLTLTYSGTFLAAATGTFNLQYEFTPLSLQVLYGVQNDKICADCYYDLQIKVTDNCGNPVGQPVTQEAVFTEKTTCDPAPTKQQGQLPVTIQKPGEYNITYQLTLSRKAIDFYADQYLVQNLSLKKEIDFQRDYIHKVDISGCYNNCATCLADLGSEQDFVTKMSGVLQQQNNITPNEDDIAWMKSSYKDLLAECTLLQEGCGKTEPPCEEQTQQLRDDVSPGGQYMLYDAATNKFTERDINVFLKNNAALIQTVTVNGVSRIFKDLTEAEVITNWQDSWTDLLLPYHPENVNNCFITDCSINAESELYDKNFINTEDVDMAKTNHYWFLDDYVSVVNNDPYFKAGAEGASKKAAFINSLGGYKTTGLDIMSFVRWKVYCQQPAPGDYPLSLTACPRTEACNRQQDEWAVFKTLYYSAKQEIMDKNTGCNSNALFPDPTAALLPVINSGAPVPVGCAAVQQFSIANNNGTVIIKYAGPQKTEQAITLRYFAVNSSGTEVTSAAGTVIFASGTAEDDQKTITGTAGLTYILDYARCDLAHPYYSKSRRNYNGVSMSGISGQITPPNKTKEQLNADAAANMINECNESCEQSADGWMKKLEGCNLDITSTEYTQIHDGLIAVCKGSCQVNVADHPFGASSTPTPTANGDNNFKDVLLRVLGQARFTSVCNDLLLDYPPPIGVTPLYTNEIVRTLSSCAYDKLKAWKTAYESTTGYSSFTDYVQKTIDPSFNLTDAEANSLLSATENNCVTPQPIQLPASLSCTAAQPKTCLTCTEMQDEKINFATAYPYVTADGPDYYELLAKYINRKYNFNLSSVDVYQALQGCAAGTGGGTGVTNTISCAAFTAAYNHFEQLKPDYFTNPNYNYGNPDSLYKIHLTLWLNTELNRNLGFDYYNSLATKCNLSFNYPGNSAISLPFGCDSLTGIVKSFRQTRTGNNTEGDCSGSFTSYINSVLGASYTVEQYNDWSRKKCGRIITACCDSCTTDNTIANCAPQFITCCEPFTELERFKQVYTDSVNARLLALYFSLLHTQWCTPVNLPNVDYNLPYDSIVSYFAAYKLANAYNITVRPDSLISYTVSNTGSCTATALNFKANPGNHDDVIMFAVCNKPAQPTLALDPNSCINQQISVAIGNAHSDYLDYVASIKRDYRDAYFTKCLSITPQLKLEAVYNQPLEYHYTLYYYDQAGNLAKTIPPAGVQPVDEATDGAANMDRIKNFRLADKDYCYEYGDAPAMNGNASITVADNTAIQQNTLPFTVEAFVNFSNLGGTQTILSKQSNNIADNKTDGYKIYLDNGRLKVDLAAHGAELWTQTLSKLMQYTFPSYYTPPIPPVTVRSKVYVNVPRTLYRSLTAQITSDISGLISSGQWAYIAVQQTGDWRNPVRIYINGTLVNTELLANNYDYTPATSPAIDPAELAAGTTEFSFAYTATTVPLTVNNTSAANLVVGNSSNGLNGSIKQVRIYNRALPAAEIRNNAYNTCLVPQSEGNLVIWLPLNKEETAGVSLDRINQYTTVNVATAFSNLYQPVYPTHKLPTHYYYNSLNAVTKQTSPDGGTSNFWYDLLGRLVVSQNAEQLVSTRGELNNRYSYTKYDALGRITEVGEKTGAATMTTAIAKTDPTNPGSAINSWLASGTNIQVTQTIYDQADISVVTNTAITGNQNIYNTSRKRVVATIYRNSITTATDYNSATHYQYDINGNVKRLWQEHKKSFTGLPVNLLKDLQYNYDLVSGKVNHVIYQEGKGDQFVYKYEYDPDNRLIKAYSGRDMNTLQLDAGYRYYLHGPLGRMELGAQDRIVQGCDYAYTLQGWLKGVNGTLLAQNGVPGLDMGNDGSNVTAAGLGATTAADATAFTLGYYQGDYTPIGGGTLAPAFGIQYQHPAVTGGDISGKALFNGNISNASYAIAKIDNGLTRGYSYGYDQLNRLKDMQAHDLSSMTVAGGAWNNSNILAGNDYKEHYTYDANGNILGLFRNGTSTGGRNLAMDNLTYSYYYRTINNIQKTYSPDAALPADAWTLSNQLAHVKDDVPVGNYPSAGHDNEKDIDNQPDNNYTYDGIGNLVADQSEGIGAIQWTVYGKIRSIDKTDGTKIVYDYDAAGNRIQKQVTDAAAVSPRKQHIAYYIRDAQGNTIGVYSWTGPYNSPPTAAADGAGVTGETWDEQHLYGSSRLGIWKPGIPMPTTLNTTTDAVQIGSKLYELTNHLGNVLATITDNKIAIPSQSNSSLTDHYEADIVSAQDYYAFGMQMPGRQFTGGVGYRYGFNGKENDNEVKGDGNQQDYGMRIYDARLGRWCSTDAITKPWLSPFNFGANNPINNIDPDGKDEIHFHFYTTVTKGPDGMVVGGPTYAKIEIIKANGPDRFFHHNHGTEIQLPTNYSKGGISTFEKTIEFYPWNPDSRSGLTTTSVLGLFNRDDRDYATLIKYASANPELKNYLHKRSNETEAYYSDKENYKGLLEDIPAYNAVAKIKHGADLSVAMLSIVEDGIPLGFKNAEQFVQAGNELKFALAESGIEFKNVGVRGSAVTRVSSKGGGFRFERARGLPKSDIDVFVDLFEDLPLNGSKKIPGFIHPEKMAKRFPALEQWSAKWSEILNRDISVGAFKPGTFRDNNVINF